MKSATNAAGGTNGTNHERVHTSAAVVITVLGWWVLATAEAQAQALQNNRILISLKPDHAIVHQWVNLTIMTGTTTCAAGTTI